MRMIFVRHGDPNYGKDILTPLGHKQAEAAGERLSGETVSKFFSSPCGRALETAEHIAKWVNFPKEEIRVLPFMREISWGATEGEQLYLKGHPWYAVDHMIENGKSIIDGSWREDDLFKRNKATAICETVGEEFDRFLTELGLTREGDYYRIGDLTDETYILTSHGGSSSAVLAHIFNMPLPFILNFIHPEMTAITVISFAGEKGTLTAPRAEIFNDARHIEGICAPNVLEN